MTLPKNAAGKSFTWSPSAVSDFITCPMQYAARRFYLTLPYVETEAMKFGTLEHKHLENRLQHKTPLPDSFTRGERYCQAFEQSGSMVITEQELAISQDLKFVSWYSKNAWGRVKIDVTTVKDGRVGCFDWKTGKVKDDSLQLKINACFLSLRHMAATEFNTRYIWLKYGTTTGEIFSATQIPQLWDEILGWVQRMETAWRTALFLPKSSGLCRSYCAVTSCKFCGRGGY